MSPDSRITNLTRNCKLKPHQAEARIVAGVAEWVTRGVSIRELTMAEVLEKRSHEQIFGKPHEISSLPPSEVENVTWDPPQRERYTQAPRRELIKEALKFAKNPEAYASDLSASHLCEH